MSLLIIMTITNARAYLAFEPVREIPSSISLSHIEDAICDLLNNGVYWGQFHNHILKLIACESSCWHALEELIDHGAIPFDQSDSSPSPLELAGIAIRDQGNLSFTSPLMQTMIKRYYSHKRFGDLYARAGIWNRAFAHYEYLSAEERIRPIGVQDSSNVEINIRAFSSSLYTTATIGYQEVKNHFVKGCQYLPGFPHIHWYSSVTTGSSLLEEISPECREMLNTLEPFFSSGSNELLRSVPEPWGRYVSVVLLPTLRDDQKEAVIVGDFEKRTIISRERKQYIEDLLISLIKAYDHAISFERNRIHLSERDNYIEIINIIFEALGSTVRDVGETLRVAAEELVNLQYRRILFSLVDPERTKIQCVLGKPDEANVEFAIQHTNWPLSNYAADIQPYVIQTKKAKIILDASREILTNKKIVQQLDIKAFAIVPMLDRSGDAIGTIHVERKDGFPPSRDEVENLIFFGRLLAIALEQSERVNLLQSALDKIPEPVIIVDSMPRHRYANRPAEELLNVSTGWQPRDIAEPIIKKTNDANLCRLSASTIRQNSRIVKNVKGIGNRPEYQAQVLCDSIQNWRNQTTGAVLHIQDLNYLYVVLEMFRKVAESTDTNEALGALFDSAQLLGNGWGRLFVIDKNNPEQFIGKTCFGMEDSKHREIFESGDYVLRSERNPQNLRRV